MHQDHMQKAGSHLIGRTRRRARNLRKIAQSKYGYCSLSFIDCNCNFYWYYSSMLPSLFLSSLVWSPLRILVQFPTLIWLFLWLYMALPVSTVPSQSPFPNILFMDFSRVVTTTFGSGVTLATVLAILFSLTENNLFTVKIAVETG